MASGLVLSFRPAVIRACATPGGDRRSEGPGRSSGTWWTPLFGWPSEPDYIEGGRPAPVEAGAEEGKRPPARRFAAFTEEKARELRMKTMEMETFHDVMYHSTIASRLASNLPPRRSAR
ncbi:hypothetical protein COCNU_02G000150 [Cocos nucifera]|uniref:Uncharacterized protein n=1 Tax=Cocos nucifera TaxID=13894 RepID=A0A8K0HXZ6_COCNU|nr:hypothetical protein COCNU_02G000150 [Cocos nucifera]